MKHAIVVILACVSAVLLAGCTTSIPFNFSEAEWNAMSPARQSTLRRLADSREPAETRGFERENFQLNADRAAQDLRANTSAPPSPYP